MIVEGPSLSTRPRADPVLIHDPPKNGFRLVILFVLLICALAGSFILGLYRELQALQPLAQSFNCTVYYTPLESAFSKAQKFNLTPETRPGLKGISYPADFLKAVALEGFGKISNPVEGMPYLYYNGKWGYAAKPVGNHVNALQPKVSCAVSVRKGELKSGSWVVLRSKDLPSKIESRPWRIDDVGAGVGRNQIDLYWGEAAPFGPGSDLERPAGIDMSRVRNITVCLLPGDTRLCRFWSTLHHLPLSSLALYGLNPLVDYVLQHSPVEAAGEN